MLNNRIVNEFSSLGNHDVQKKMWIEYSRYGIFPQNYGILVIKLEYTIISIFRALLIHSRLFV